MADGWIKLHRCLMNKAIFDNEKLLKVFIWCLLKASRKEREQAVGLQKVLLAPGQFIYGRNRASQELNMPGTTIHRYMTYLKDNRTIDIKPNNKFSVVTVVNWGFYQSQEEEVDSKTDNKRTTNGQQMDTNKNSKNSKNVNKDIIREFTSNENLIQTIKDFKEMRTKIRKPMTDRAVTLLLNNLNKLATDDETKIAILEQSIANSWQGVFPLKDGDKKPKKRNYDEDWGI